MITWAPALPSAVDMANPIPLADPVTSAVRSFREKLVYKYSLIIKPHLFIGISNKMECYSTFENFSIECSHYNKRLSHERRAGENFRHIGAIGQARRGFGARINC
jgi:hypothetical protein